MTARLGRGWARRAPGSARWRCWIRRNPEPYTVGDCGAGAGPGKAGAWERALALLDQMRAAGVRPDVVTYTSLIAACQACGGRWQAALALLNQMEAEGAHGTSFALCRPCAPLDLPSWLGCRGAAPLLPDPCAFSDCISRKDGDLAEGPQYSCHLRAKGWWY